MCAPPDISLDLSIGICYSQMKPRKSRIIANDISIHKILQLYVNLDICPFSK